MAEILLSASSGQLTTGGTGKASTLSNKVQDQIRVLDPKTGTALLNFRQSNAKRNGMVVVRSSGSSYSYGRQSGRYGCDHVAISQQDRPAIHFWSWGREQPRMRCSLPVHVGPMAMEREGRYLFGGTKEGRLLVWDTLTGELVQSIDAHRKSISVVRVMEDNSHVITGGNDADVFVWLITDLLDGENLYVKTKKRKMEKVSGTTVDDGNEEVEAKSRMEGTYVEPICTWNAHTLGVTDILTGWGSTHGSIITSSLDHSVKFWKYGDRSPLHSITFPTYINCLTSDDEQRCLYVGGGNGTIYLVQMRAVATDRYNSTTGAGFSINNSGSGSSTTGLASSFGGGSSGSSGSSSSSSSSSSNSSNSSSSSRNASSAQAMNKIEGSHSGPVLCMALSSTGSTLFSGGGDGIVCGWDTNTRQQLFTVAHAGPVTNVLCMKRPTDLLRSKSHNATASMLRPLPPLQKHRRTEHAGSTMTFLTATSGLNTEKETNVAKRRKRMTASTTATVKKSSISETINSNESLPGTTDKSMKLLERLAELESENLRWQTLATKLRQMLNAKSNNGK